jgi:predicted membrane-bound mannosyltransferase
VLEDGSQYFHACPPLSAAELRAAVEAGAVALTKRQQHALDRAEAFDASLAAKLSPAHAVSAFYESITVPRPNARDENIDLVKVAASLDARGARTPGTTAEAVMKSPGAGVVPL